MNRKRAKKLQEARALLKIQAVASASQHLSRLIPNAVSELADAAFPDMKGIAIDQVFLPQLLGQVQQEVKAKKKAQQVINGIVAACDREQLDIQRSGFAVHKERFLEVERKRYEEMQIRHGKIRILVDDEAGGKTPIGPIQISTQEDIDAIQSRVFEWLQENKPDLSAAWPWGVILCIDGETVQSTEDIFSSKFGQLSMVAKPEPPPADDVVEGEEGDVGDGGEGGGG